MTEWRPVVDYPGYEISDEGQVRSLDRTITCSNGVQQRRKGQLLSTKLDASGYCRVSLYRDGERSGSKQAARRRKVHHLVLEAFVGPRPEASKGGLHWDDDPYNNSLPNLRWGTQSENVTDKVRNGKHPMASKTHCKHGHAYTEENTYRYPSTGYRACRTCIRNQDRKN